MVKTFQAFCCCNVTNFNWFSDSFLYYQSSNSQLALYSQDASIPNTVASPIPPSAVIKVTGSRSADLQCFHTRQSQKGMHPYIIFMLTKLARQCSGLIKESPTGWVISATSREGPCLYPHNACSILMWIFP